ncbi:MAG: acyltransferase family protein, partial [Acidimicrobiales bacterium]
MLGLRLRDQPAPATGLGLRDQPAPATGLGLRDQPRLGYRPALDGMRAVSIVVVMCFHDLLIKGGYLGVNVFFVLSGFLITSLLTEEFSSSGRIAVGNFYIRRALRLLPCLFLVVAAVFIYDG